MTNPIEKFREVVIVELTMEQLNVIAGAVMIVFAAIVGGFGNAWVVSRFINGVARQPDARGALLVQTIIGVALVEVIPIIAVAIGILKILNVL